MGVSGPRMESTVRRMIWGVRALNTMARHAHSSAAAKCPQQGRRYFPIRASFSRRDNFRVVSMKAKTLPLSFFSLFQIPGTKKAPSHEDAPTAAMSLLPPPAGALQVHDGPRHDNDGIVLHAGHHLSVQMATVYKGRRYLSRKTGSSVKNVYFFKMLWRGRRKYSILKP